MRPEAKKIRQNGDGEKRADTPLPAKLNTKKTAQQQSTTSKPSIPSTTAKPAVSAKSPAGPVAIATANIPKNPPKKGSFAEIMARQNATKTATPPMTIQNKPKERISEKQRLKLLKRGLLDKAKNTPKNSDKSGHNRGALDTRTPTPISTKAKVKDRVEKESKCTGNLVTPKPKPQPTYRGMMKTVPKNMPAREKAKPRPSRDRYLDTDEEEESDDDEIDGSGEAVSADEYSDESEDMEAGFDDVEEEEEQAVKQAKIDDAQEAALEAKLKRDKDEKKKRLMQLAKSAKPRSY